MQIAPRIPRSARLRRYLVVATPVAIAAALGGSVLALTSPTPGELPPGAEVAQATGSARLRVVDSTGEVRGYVVESEPRVPLPGGVMARPVYSLADDGSIVGYMTAGPAGFVDLATAADGARLGELISCYESYTGSVAGRTKFDEACREILAAVGVEIIGR